MYAELKKRFYDTFGAEPVMLFSAPGRTELCGNHTDHQGGMVLGAAVNLETVAAIRPRYDGKVRLLSEGYPLCEVSLDDLVVHTEEYGTTTALIRGVAAGFSARGAHPVGFDACVCSGVVSGSGLSSSAAFEVLIGTIENHLTGLQLPALEIARIGQNAENHYFGKPSGLLDQASSACGGVVFVDFDPSQETKAESISVNFADYGYAICVVDSGASHADLTDEYAKIPGELGKVSQVFGKKVLREVDESEFYARLPEIRAKTSDRAVLRAMHIYDENRRVLLARAALKNGDIQAFLRQLNASGRSSQLLLQNIIPAGAGEEQALSYTLACAEKLLDGEGVCRVQGGGFAGTIQTFVPLETLDYFCREMNRLLDADACQVISVRQAGGILLETC